MDRSCSLKKSKIATGLYAIVKTVISSIVIFYATIYTLSYAEVYLSDAVGGIYHPILNIYICENQYVCFHEQGHVEDASNARHPVFLSEWTSAGQSFRTDVDTINNCMGDFRQNNNDPKRRNLDTYKVFSMIGLVMSPDYTKYRDSQKYAEIYARVYATMKENPEEVAYSDDVVDIIAQNADYCRLIEREIAQYE